MKIEGKVTSPIAGEVGGSSKTARPGNVPVRETPAAGESVEVQVSALATQLREIGTRMRAGDVVDAEKVAEIRLAIAEGRYEIKPEVIAERLLETVRELVSEKPPSKP